MTLAALLVVLTQAGAGGDAERGQREYQARCLACHSEDVSNVGPAHRGVVGRKAGSLPGFDYSPALRASRIVWSPATLDRWLTNPEKLIPGQRMWFTVAEPAVRRDLIAYLQTLGAP